MKTKHEKHKILTRRLRVVRGMLTSIDMAFNRIIKDTNPAFYTPPMETKQLLFMSHITGFITHLTNVLNGGPTAYD